LAAIALIAGGAGCKRHVTPPSPSDPPSAAPEPVRQIIAECGPFTSADGRWMLDFAFPDTVTLGPLSSKPHPPGQRGTFALDEARRQVRVSLGGEVRAYSAYLPNASQDCFLLEGAPASADLTKSWFGQVQPPNGD
jgi:hypothetical protein